MCFFVKCFVGLGSRYWGGGRLEACSEAILDKWLFIFGSADKQDLAPWLAVVLLCSVDFNIFSLYCHNLVIICWSKTNKRSKIKQLQNQYQIVCNFGVVYSQLLTSKQLKITETKTDKSCPRFKLLMRSLWNNAVTVYKTFSAKAINKKKRHQHGVEGKKLGGTEFVQSQCLQICIEWEVSKNVALKDIWGGNGYEFLDITIK